MSQFKVVCLTSSSASGIDLAVEREILRSVGAKVVVASTGSEAETIDLARGADAIFHRDGRLTARVIGQLAQCRIIAHGGVGYDLIDLQAATANGIIVTNVADYCTEEVSDHAVLLLLALNRLLRPLTTIARRDEWQQQPLGPIARLREQTVAVVGFGRIGGAFGRKAQALGLRVLAVDPYVDDDEIIQAGVVSRSLPDALREADYVSVHTPLTNETHHLFGAGEFRLMKPSAYFINTARGTVVDEAALIRALTEGLIAGAGLDVLEREPPDPSNPLLCLENVLVTPHAGYFSEASIRDLRRTMAEQVACVFQGQWPRFVVNPAVRHRVALRPSIDDDAHPLSPR